MIHWTDLTLVTLFFLAFPLYDARAYPRTAAALASGEKSRGREYAEILIVLWAATVALAWIWAHHGRSPTYLALGLPLPTGPGAWLGWGLTALGTAYFAYCLRAATRSGTALEQVREGVGNMKELLPHTRRQLLGFSAVGTSAGICEELLYRGFLFWWLREAVGMGVVVAAVVSTLAFGYAHAYQGWRGIGKSALAGALFLAIRLLTGSIWPAIWLHAIGDVTAGWLAYRAYGPTVSGTGSGEAGVAPGAGNMLDTSSVARPG